MYKNKQLIIHFLYGLVSYIFIVFISRNLSSSFEEGYFSGKNLLILLAVLSFVSGYFVSLKYNKNNPLPIGHPITNFISILFSKISIVPSALFPLGGISGVILFSLVESRLFYPGTYKLALGIFVMLYTSAFIGVIISITRFNK